MPSRAIERQLDWRPVIISSPARVKSVHRQQCSERHGTPARAGTRQRPGLPIASSPSLFLEPGIDLRHQDRPEGKFPDLRFSRQSA